MTKTDKVLRRLAGQDHYRAKKSGARKRKGRQWVKVAKPLAKRIKKLIG